MTLRGGRGGGGCPSSARSVLRPSLGELSFSVHRVVTKNGRSVGFFFYLVFVLTIMYIYFWKKNFIPKI